MVWWCGRRKKGPSLREERRRVRNRRHPLAIVAAVAAVAALAAVVVVVVVVFVVVVTLALPYARLCSWPRTRACVAAPPFNPGISRAGHLEAFSSGRRSEKAASSLGRLTRLSFPRSLAVR
jgi:cytochrome c-type biogenesis protein CcmH/NrfG